MDKRFDENRPAKWPTYGGRVVASLRTLENRFMMG